MAGQTSSFTGLRFAFIGADVVCLDVDRDRYFGLSGEAAAALRSFFSGRPMAARDCEVLAELERRDILRTPSTRSLPDAPLRPETSLFDEVSPKVAVMDWLAMIRHVLAARRRVRRSLATAIGHIRPDAGAPNRLAQDVSKLRAVCAAHRAGDLIFPAADACLPRSLALLAHLRAAGQGADLILGVMLRPFQAHCWVQQGTIVLNDRPEHVATFTPIMVL